MLLALWFDFPPASWTGGPTPPPVVQNIDGGSSGVPRDYWQTQWPRGRDDYFDAREAHLRANLPVKSEPTQQPVKEVQAVVAASPKRVIALPTKQLIIGDLNVLGAQQKLMRLQQQWVQLQQQQEDEAIELLLLS